MKKISTFAIILMCFFITCLDVFAENFQDDIPASYLLNHSFKKKVVYKPLVIVDDTAPQKVVGKKQIYKPVIYQDYKIILSDEDRQFVRPVYDGTVDLIDGVAVKITPLNTIKTSAIAKKIGDMIVYCEVPQLRSKIPFVIVEPLILNGETILAKGVTVIGTVGNVVVQEGGGVPGELVVEKFYTHNTKGQKVNLDGKIHVVGHNTALFAHTLNSMVLSGSSQAMPGSAAVLKKGKVFSVYYK